jgi:replicative DNA helicase
MRTPPTDMRAEEAVIGAMLLTSAAIALAGERLTADSYWRPAHGHIHHACMRLYANGEPCDPVTVADELARNNLLDAVGGPHTLINLQSQAPPHSSVGAYITIVDEMAALRQLIAAGTAICELGYQMPDDIDDTINQAEQLVYQLSTRRTIETTSHVDDLLNQTIDTLHQRVSQPGVIRGQPTGLHDLDQLTGGLKPSQLIILGARPGCGKTSAAINIATHSAVATGKPSLIFSLEMSRQELSERMLSSEAMIDSRTLREGTLTGPDWDRITRAQHLLATAPIWIDDNPTATVLEMRSKARKLKSAVGTLGMVVVDYVQLMGSKTRVESRQVEVAEISRGLKILARELETPVIALAQLNRSLEQRADKRPMLSDLRESGSLEQDADIVMFLYRDELYHDDTPDRGTAELIVAKHRAGPTATIRLGFLAQYTRFVNNTQQTIANPATTRVA